MAAMVVLIKESDVETRNRTLCEHLLRWIRRFFDAANAIRRDT